MNAEIIPSTHHAVSSFFVSASSSSGPRISAAWPLGAFPYNRADEASQLVTTLRLCVDVLGRSKTTHSDYR